MSFFGFGKKKETGPFASIGEISNYQLVLAYGIVNPFGPTMNLLLRTKEPSGGKHKFVLLMCHPFSPEIRYSWTCSPNEKDILDTLNQIGQCLSKNNDSCPTLFITGPNDNFESMLEILVLIAANGRGGLKTYNRCKKYVGNAFDRITEEVSSMLAKEADTPMGMEKAAEFVVQQLTVGMQSELMAFKTAYEGSIGFQRQNGSPLNAVLPYEEFQKIMDKLIQ